MIGRHVVGDEVEHQLQAATLHSLPEPGESRVAAEVGVHGVAGDREAGAGDVVVDEVRERLVKLAAPFGIGARDSLGGEPGLPDAEQPDPVESQLGQPVELGVGNVVKRRNPSERAADLRQPDARVDLVQDVG